LEPESQSGTFTGGAQDEEAVDSAPDDVFQEDFQPLDIQGAVGIKGSDYRRDDALEFIFAGDSHKSGWGCGTVIQVQCICLCVGHAKWELYVNGRM
jgi:hypothetical protein